ncbi:MAG TPA: three-Cys-motif partner protein TcmP [Candidatus Lokiarchaeia archaeon]|nr:three-Cys-motif partner protein TcmP [Candidatus Lokiarchaeia archaeon]
MSSSKQFDILNEHSKIKLDILRKYIHPYFVKVGSGFNKIHYIDGFAGTGKYKSGEDGSPILALKAAVKTINMSKNRKLEITIHLIEHDPKIYSGLEKSIEALTKTEKIERITIKKHLGDFEDQFFKIIDEIGPLEPCFFFLDPYGYAFLRRQDIFQRIFSKQKSEILLIFMSQFFHRFYKSSNMKELSCQILGKDGFEAVQKMDGPEHERERDVFIKVMKSYRPENPILHSYYDIYRPDQSRTEYFLIHFTQHEAGRKLMREIMGKEGKDDSFRYHGPGEKYERTQTTLLAFSSEIYYPEKEKVLAYLKDHYNNKRVSFRKIYNEIFDSIEKIKESDIRKTIQELERNGTAIVSRNDSRKTSVHDDDVITFNFP